MPVPKKMYRIHPALGFFQSTLVTAEEAAAQLASEGWSDDMPANFVEGSIPGNPDAPATVAAIDTVIPADVMGA